MKQLATLALLLLLAVVLVGGVAADRGASDEERGGEGDEDWQQHARLHDRGPPGVWGGGAGSLWPTGPRRETHKLTSTTSTSRSCRFAPSLE